MNRTLLLIICDFLLLNLLALTRWDKAEPVPTQQPPVPKLEANIAAQQDQDLVGLMKRALEDERTTRERLVAQMLAQKSQLETNLAITRQEATALQAEATRREQALAAALRAGEAEQARLNAQMQQALADRQAELQRQQQLLAALQREKTEMQAQAAKLAKNVRTAEAEKDLVREQMEKQLQQALAEKQTEIERQQRALVNLEQQRNAAVQQAASLATAVKVAETERNLLRENVDHLKGEVAVVRQEKEKLFVSTTKLADGVTELAVKSDELRKEILENTPVNMNVMFDEFLSNRVNASISALAPGVFGTTLRTKAATTALIGDGTNVCAVLHVNETPFTLSVPATGMNIVSAQVTRSLIELAQQSPVKFSSTDPRVVLVPLPSPPANVKVYSLAQNPFKFTEAVLISRGGRYYGEVEFKLDPRTPHYVRMKNRLVTRLFGEFSPSAGDLVLSKTGEFLGIMVTSDYCMLVRNLESFPGDTFDKDTLAPQMRTKLEEMRRRLDWLSLILR